MKILIRYTFNFNEKNLSEIEIINLRKACNEYFKKCKKYSIDDEMRLVRLPINSQEYTILQEFLKKYDGIVRKICMYDIEYTKKEKEIAEFYLLKCKSIVIPDSIADIDGYCCSEKTIKNLRFYDYTIKESDMKNRSIAFTSNYRFLVSPMIKEECERQKISNIVFEPVYTRKKKLVAYFIESEDHMSELSSVNNWPLTVKCNKCNKILYDGTHTVPHPFLIPLNEKQELKDFNSTQEQFTELRARNYVISKKLYQILLNSGAKNLICQPIQFIN